MGGRVGVPIRVGGGGIVPREVDGGAGGEDAVLEESAEGLRGDRGGVAVARAHAEGDAGGGSGVEGADARLEGASPASTRAEGGGAPGKDGRRTLGSSTAASSDAEGASLARVPCCTDAGATVARKVHVHASSSPPPLASARRTSTTTGSPRRAPSSRIARGGSSTRPFPAAAELAAARRSSRTRDSAGMPREALCAVARTRRRRRQKKLDSSRPESAETTGAGAMSGVPGAPTPIAARLTPRFRVPARDALVSFLFSDPGVADPVLERGDDWCAWDGGPPAPAEILEGPSGSDLAARSRVTIALAPGATHLAVARGRRLAIAATVPHAASDDDASPHRLCVAEIFDAAPPGERVTALCWIAFAVPGPGSGSGAGAGSTLKPLAPPQVHDLCVVVGTSAGGVRVYALDGSLLIAQRVDAAGGADGGPSPSARSTPATPVAPRPATTPPRISPSSSTPPSFASTRWSSARPYAERRSRDRTTPTATTPREPPPREPPPSSPPSTRRDHPTNPSDGTRRRR